MPYTFDNDLDGLLSANGHDLLEGEYELTGVVYTNDADIHGSTCASSESPIHIKFLLTSDSACFVEEPCATGVLVVTGDSEVCSDETMTVNLINPADIPAGGGYAIDFYDPGNVNMIRLPGVSLPFTFDNNLNGFISANGYDLLEGEYELTGIVYSDANNIETSGCAMSEAVVIINFLSALYPACLEEPCDVEPLVLIGDSEVCPGETATVDLISSASIPTGGILGIKLHNPITGYGIVISDVTLPYTFDNDLNGFITTIGFDLLEGEYELTGIVYTDETDIIGSTCDSSEVVVIVNFLSASDPACIVEEHCATEALVVTGDSDICSGETTTVSLINPAVIPTGGGYGIKFHNPTTDHEVAMFGVTLPYTFDNDLGGVLSENNYDLLEGEYELSGIVYADANNIGGSVCDTSASVVTVDFLSDSDLACVTGIAEPESNGGFVIYPNPASDYITLKVNDRNIKNADFRIMDMGGRILFEEVHLKLNADNSYHIDVSNIAQGVYFVVLYSEYGMKTNRLVITK